MDHSDVSLPFWPFHEGYEGLTKMHLLEPLPPEKKKTSSCKLDKTAVVPDRTASSMQKRSHITLDKPSCKGMQSSPTAQKQQMK